MFSPVSVIDRNAPMPENLLTEGGILRLLLAEEYDRFDHTGLRLWCHHHGRYGLPTMELVDWLGGKIGGRTALEIGAGAGDLCHHLAILGTDSYQQRQPEVRQYMRLIGQPPVPYGKHVVEARADLAIAKFEPEVVVASWVTQWIDPDLPIPPGGGNAWGIKEDEIVMAGLTYILIGNISVHGDKRIMALPHREYDLPFVRSRSSKPELNRVWVWNA